MPSPLSFDTSLIKFFCKTPETEKNTSISKCSSTNLIKRPEKTEKCNNFKSRFLFETDPSFEDITIDLIKSIGNEDSHYSKEKFDGTF